MPWIPPAWVVRPAMRVRRALARAHALMAPPPLLLMERMNGMVEARVLSLVADLGIPDLLAGGPRTAEELAREAGVDAGALDRALAFLASLGLLGRRGGRYANNSVSEWLRSDHPESIRGWVRFLASDWHWQMWSHARHSLETGEGAAPRAFGLPFFDYLTRGNLEAGRDFNLALESTSGIAGPIVARGYDFRGIRRLCDVGGGTGGMLAAILEAHPAIRGVLFDLPPVAEQARERLAARGLLDARCDVVAGSFFDAVPEGCDAYLMQAIVHDWDDDSCVRLLANCRRAMAPGGRVLVIENVLRPEPHPADAFARSFDLVMLVTSGSGRERTLAEFEALFARAGLRPSRDVLLPSMFHVLEAVAAP